MASEWRPVALPGCEDVIQGDVLPAAMERDEAQACITRVKEYWQRCWFELKAFHGRQGWRALGYRSFSMCIETELRISRQQVYRLLEAAEIRAELAAALEPAELSPRGDNLDAMTEYHARVLKPLPSEARVEIARRTDFRETSAPQLRETVERAKMALEQLDDEQPDWDAVVSHVEQAPSVVDAKLVHDYSVAVCRVTDRLLELDPDAVAGLLNDADRLAALDFIGELRAWCSRFEGALQQPIRLLPEGSQR